MSAAVIVAALCGVLGVVAAALVTVALIKRLSRKDPTHSEDFSERNQKEV